MTPRAFFDSARVVGLPRRRMLLLVGFSLAMALCEAAGIAFLLPIFQYIQENGDLAKLAAEQRIWPYLVEVYGALGLQVSLVWLLLSSFVFILCRQLVQFGQLVYSGHVRNALIADIRARLFDAFLAADLTVVEREATGHLLNEFTVEAENATTSLMQFLQLCALLALSVVYIAGLLMLSPAMTLISGVMMVFTALALRGVFGRTLQVGQRVLAANQEVGRFLVERLKALRLIRLSSTEDAEQKHARRLLDEQRRQRQQAEQLNARLTVAIEPIFVALAFAFLWFATERLKMQLGEIGLFLVVALRLMPIGKDAMRARQNILQTLSGLSAIMDRLNMLGSVREQSGGANLVGHLAQGIEFCEATFSYDGVSDGSTPAISDINLLIPAGAITAVVGTSGAGKSTLVDLLPQLRRLQTGVITFDGQPVETISRSALRKAIAFVPQMPQIFDVTPAEHIRYGRADASDAQVRTAARLAGAYDFIMRLPQGFSTPLGEGGGRLSGGQRQRLDLARALVREAPILILDEPTSALDAEAEQAFKAALLGIKRERGPTILMIGHRLSTAAIADLIVVMDHGRIIDKGSHDDLIARGGWYARAWGEQTSRVMAAS